MMVVHLASLLSYKPKDMARGARCFCYAIYAIYAIYAFAMPYLARTGMRSEPMETTFKIH